MEPARLGRQQRWDREREALQMLSRQLAEETRGGHLEDALEVVLSAVGAERGAAFSSTGSVLELAAERGLSTASDRPEMRAQRDAMREALLSCATHARTARKLWQLQVEAPADLDPNHLAELERSGIVAVAAQPVKHQREVLGVLVVLAADRNQLDAHALSFLSTVASMVALAAERDRRVEREQGYRAELAEAGHMAALGLLTATVAHELRGPVSALAVQVAEQQHIIDQLSESRAFASFDAAHSELSELLLDMNQAVTQMSTVIAELSSLSRRDAAPDKVDLGAVAREGLAIARSALSQRGIRLVEDYAPSSKTIGRRDNLVQVLLTLVFNAADACTLSDEAERRITVSTRTEASRVILSVDDTGPGIPPEEMQLIFRPIFASKQRGRGTGLGLKICSDVVSAHHGHMELVNLQPRGASFRVILPRLRDPDVSLLPQNTPTAPPRSERAEIRQVLVVDDDDLFARTMRRALKPHDVRTAATASEAEIALLDSAYSPHLVLCDLGLPGMTGDMLHARVRSMRPALAEHFIFVTGGACTKAEADYLRQSGCATLLKPIDIKDIWAALAAPHPRVSLSPEAVATLRAEPMIDPPISSEMPTQPPG